MGKVVTVKLTGGRRSPGFGNVIPIRRMGCIGISRIQVGTVPHQRGSKGWRRVSLNHGHQRGAARRLILGTPIHW